MALREPLMQKVVSLSSATTATLLTVPTALGYKVKGIHVLNPPTGSAGSPVFMTLKVQRTTIGFWRIDSTYGNHLGYKDSNSKNDSLFTYLVREGIFPPIPLVQGEALIAEFSSAYTGDILLTYEVYDAGDVQSTAPLGSQATELYYILYGTNATAITSDGYYELTEVFNPVEFPRFPFGEKVPANTVIEIIGCLAQEVGRYVDGSNNAITTRLRFVRGLTELFDEDKLGFLMRGAYSTTAGYYYGTGKCYFTSAREDKSLPPKLFSPTLVFQPGEELKIYVGVDCTGSNGTLAARTIDVPLIMHVRRAG